jgi:GTP 3',8-cyclase
LIDGYSRVINYLRISITDRCNLNCKYCSDNNLPYIAHEDILRYEEIIRIVRIAASLGVRKVRLTGGEPLRRKGVEFLIEEIHGVRGIEDISMTTNGVELEAHLSALKLAGLKRINVSLDSLKAEKFSFITGADALDKVLGGIRKAKELGLEPVKINTVIIKDFNEDEILDFVQFAKEWGVHVRFIEFMPFGNEDLWNKSKIVSSAYIQNIICSAHELSEEHHIHIGPAKTYRIAGSNGHIGFISPMSSHICETCNRLRLTSDGALKPCLFSDREYDVKRLLRSGATDEEIGQFIKDVVNAKPEKKFEAGVIRKCQRSMRSTGG